MNPQTYVIPELGLTLDAGTGLYRMVDHLDDDRFDVYLSHDHPDHTHGLTSVWHVFFKRATLEAMAGHGPTYRGAIPRHWRQLSPQYGSTSPPSICPMSSTSSRNTGTAP
jgi:phosphoribosyl 1,2-cyclic phosphodiesterase